MKWIMGLLIPCILIIIGALVLLIKPKMGRLFGYRTKKSLSSDECWDYANKVMSVSMIIINALAVIPLICIFNIFIRNTLIIVLSDIAAAVIGLIVVISITEIKLRKKYNIGNDRNQNN